VDLPFLTLAGHSAAPANAVPDVKSVVEYLSPYRTSESVRDILRHFGIRP
jgi:hydroxymethylpyrimidine pyrophosphatase-like HAD family hydrolase